MRYVLVVLLLVAGACSQSAKEAEDDVEWEQMDEFHTIMADVYHPLKDSMNLAPIKSGAGDLAAAATKWAQSNLPKKVDDTETKELLAKLEDGTQALKNTINTATDEEIAAQLTSLHDTFHSIMEKWYSSGAEEHHDH